MKPFRYKKASPGYSYDVFRRCNNELLGQIFWNERKEDGKTIQKWSVEVAVVGSRSGRVLIRGITTYSALRRDDLARYLMRYPPLDWPMREATRARVIEAMEP